MCVIAYADSYVNKGLIFSENENTVDQPSSQPIASTNQGQQQSSSQPEESKLPSESNHTAPDIQGGGMTMQEFMKADVDFPGMPTTGFSSI